MRKRACLSFLGGKLRCQKSRRRTSPVQTSAPQNRYTDIIALEFVSELGNTIAMEISVAKGTEFTASPASRRQEESNAGQSPFSDPEETQVLYAALDSFRYVEKLLCSFL